MELNLKKRPKNPIIIEGFPGFGLVGTISTEYLINHLNTELIGTCCFEELPATIAIHGEKIIYPLEVHYCKEKNLIIVHSIGASMGLEWKISEAIEKLAIDLKAKEIISIEGVGSPMQLTTSRVFFYTNTPSNKKVLIKTGALPLREGIVMGVTSALLMKSNQKLSAIFAETHTKLPDSKAAAEVIKILDSYLGLNVDYKPLLKSAKDMEEKLRGIIKQSKDAVNSPKSKDMMNYVG